MPFQISKSPEIATATDVIFVADEAERLALADDLGQVVRQIDDASLWVQIGTPATLAASWEVINIGERPFTVVATSVERLAASSSVGQVVMQSNTGEIWLQVLEPGNNASDWRRIDTALSQGVYTGTAATFAGLPASRQGGGTLQTGDWSYLSAVDGSNTPGVYAWNGTAWALSFSIQATANDRLFLTQSAMSGVAVAGQPSIAEVSAAIGSATDLTVYYNDTDTDDGTSTHVWHVDASGNVTVVKEPGSGDFTAEDLSSVKVQRFSAQNIPSGTATNIQFDTVVWTTGTDLTVFDDGSGDARIVVNTSGKYLITAKGGVAPGVSSTYRELSVTIDGTPVIAHGQTDGAFRPSVSGEFSLPAGSEIRMQLRHDDTVRDTEIDAKGMPTLSVRRADQKSVIPTEDVTVVHNQSNFLDIGNKRIQWGFSGNSDSAQTISLPQPFANANYSVTTCLEDVVGGGSALSGPPGDVGINYWITSGSKTTTTFQLDRDNDIDGVFVNWIAIGDKP